MKKSSIHCFIALFLAVLAFGCGTGMPENQNILVSTEWLQERLDDPTYVVLHAGTREGYDSIHIPGARLIIPAEFTVYRDSLRNEMPSPDSLASLLRKTGVNQDSRIVLYYETEALISRTARVYVSLVFAGLSDRTYFLDGGLPAWLEEKRESTGEATEYSAGDLELGTTVQVTMSASELEKERWSPQWVILDTRSQEEYLGTPAGEEPAEGGHVEGAYFLPYESSFREDISYLFKSDSELETLFRDAGMDRSKTTVVYCGSGIRASVSYLAARHLGYPVLLYDGSIQEWEQLKLPLTVPLTAPEQN